MRLHEAELVFVLFSSKITDQCSDYSALWKKWKFSLSGVIEYKHFVSDSNVQVEKDKELVRKVVHISHFQVFLFFPMKNLTMNDSVKITIMVSVLGIWLV